ncbi:MAG: hypothetical protein ACXWV7_06690 [Nitrospira sp.]
MGINQAMGCRGVSRTRRVNTGQLDLLWLGEGHSAGKIKLDEGREKSEQ